jgi:cytochrome bd-type quinol oxidase subunit 2
MVMLAVSAWQLRHGGDRAVFTRSARLALVVLVPAILFTLLVGDELGVVEGKYQPMKIAAAEGQWTTCQPCSFSLFQIGGGNNDQTPTQIIEIPHLLSLLATNHWNGQVVGMTPLNNQYNQQYGSGYYVPNVFHPVLGMRVMAYLGMVVLVIGVWGLWLLRRKTLATSRVFLWVAVWGAVLPFLMNTAGWFLTESGRQPWIVQGIMLTKNGISPTLSTTWLWISLIAFILLYGTLATVDLLLMLRYSREQLPPPRSRSRRGRAGPGRPVLGGSTMSLIPFWYIVIAILWTGFFILEGFDFGRRHAARHRRPGRGRPPGRDQHDRAAVGRQRGLADRRRGRHVRRVPGLVRDDVLGLQPRAGPAAGRPDRPRRGVRVPRQARRGPLAPHLGRAATTGSVLAPLLIGVALAGLLHGLPINSAQNYTGTFWDLFQPYALWTGVTLVLVCALHGATFLCLKTTGDMRERSWQLARRLAPLTAAFVIGFVIWTHVTARHHVLPQRDRAASHPGRAHRRSGWSTTTTRASPSPRPRSPSRPASSRSSPTCTRT